MRTFTCAICGNLLLFENSRCVRCGTEQGFDFAAMAFQPLPVPGARHCANAQIAACNWLAQRGQAMCLSCRLTRTRPRDDDAAGMASFLRAEVAKRRLVYQLVDLGLPVVPRQDDPRGLSFDLLSSGEGPVITGHNNGLVTIDLAEGDDPHREAMRVEMGEPYRTLLGHLRHEVGHYYFQVLVEGRCPGGGTDVVDAARPWTRGQDCAPAFRAVFGDERADYRAALNRHYSEGPPLEWWDSYVSAYATAHPWEDWAESFAHHLHICDTLQTAAAYGMVVTAPDIPISDLGAALRALPQDPADGSGGMRELVATWLPLIYALNAVNRSMGNDDLYPFVLTEPVIAKLECVHRLVVGASGR